MTDTTSPEGTVEAGPRSFEGGVSAIENLLSNEPGMENDGADVAKPSEVSDGVEPDDDDLVLDDDDLDEPADIAADAPAAVTDDYEISLEDGQKISLGQLKRNNLFQRDYTRKTEELKAERESLQSEHSKRVSEAEAQIRQQRELILEYASRNFPQKPSIEMLQTDPIGYMEQNAQYEQQMQVLNGIAQQRENETAAQQKAREAQEATFANDEWDKFLTKVPNLKDNAKLETFRKDVREIGIAEYGLTMDELPAIRDSRYLRILHDAIKYQQLKAKAGTVQKQVVAKPKLVQQQRMTPQTIQQRDRQGRFDALRKSGSIDAAAAAIEKML